MKGSTKDKAIPAHLKLNPDALFNFQIPVSPVNNQSAFIQTTQTE